MTLSDDEADYIDQVIDRSKRMIRRGIWEGVNEVRLDNWLGSLRNCAADLLAAYLLDNLCFRSKDQYFALLDHLFVDLPFPGEDSLQPKLIDQLRKSSSTQPTCGVRISPVIGKLAPPTKSGPYILRLAQRRYRLHNDWLIWPDQLKQCVLATDIFFVDDFCGTGEQFISFLKDIDINERKRERPNLNVHYLVTTIHENGLKHINEKYPYIHVKWTELLDSTHEILGSACLSRYEIDGFSKKINEQYCRALKAFDLPSSGKLSNGYGSLGLSYAFTHATPNNTLPIFWMEKPNLAPLLDR